MRPLSLLESFNRIKMSIYLKGGQSGMYIHRSIVTGISRPGFPGLKPYITYG
jgi:hypothetical protein